jgi:hypothetical protein
MLIILSHENEFDFNKFELEFSEDEVRSKGRDVIKIMEEYSNAGFTYLRKVYDDDPHEFNDPYVLVNILTRVKSQKNNSSILRD